MELPVGQSAFLWGARKTGKSTYLASRFPDSVYIDLLKTNLFLRYTKEPHLLREEILNFKAETLQHPIIIDEIQKVPILLDEVHWLIENTDAYFILCGSSARKLKRQGVNLLGGRAWKYTFFPLTSIELVDFDLLKIFNNGSLPAHYCSTNIHKTLRAYVEDYLTEEIKQESLVRDLAAFSRFLDSVSFSNGEKIKYANIAQDCSVSAKTVKEYFQILVDTLLGYYVEPFVKQKKRDIISSLPKFYLFDVGVANYIAKQHVESLNGVIAGKNLEHYIFLELLAYRDLNDLNFDINYWHTKTGLEVDFVLDNGKIAIEVKISKNVRKADIRGMLLFMEDYNPVQALVVSNDPTARKMLIDDKTILIFPIKEFLTMLWRGEII